jgi:ribosomal protein S18 acetylase RimI-like enzyme
VSLGPLEVRQLDTGDLDEVAALHLRAFPRSALGELGTEAVSRYYRWQLCGPHDVEGFAVLDGDHMLGYSIGGFFRGSTIGFVKRNAVFLALQVLRRPKLLFRGPGWRAVLLGIRLWTRPARHTEPERPERVPEGSFGVLVVAVEPGAHRRGVGSLLLEEAERRARANGFRGLHLTLDPENAAATSFYRDLGWSRLYLPGDSDRQWLMGKDLTAPTLGIVDPRRAEEPDGEDEAAPGA